MDESDKASRDTYPGSARRSNPWLVLLMLVVTFGLTLLAGWLTVMLPGLQQEALIIRIESLGGEVHVHVDPTKRWHHFIIQRGWQNRYGTPKRVVVRSYEIDDDMLAQICQWRQLESLDISGATVTHKGFKKVTQLSNLRRLTIAHTAMTDDWMQTLAGMTQLKQLGLDYNKQVTGSMLHQLPPQLTRLSLMGTGITDEHLAGLAHLKDLSVLLIGDTAITDAGLEHLYELKNLATLDAFPTNTTRNGYMELQHHLPDLSMRR